MKNVKVGALDAWRGDTVGLSLDADDLELVDNVLCVIPEMRVVAFLGREARKRRVKYPITGAKQLVALLRGDTFVVGGHRVDAESIMQTLPAEWFPLAHEGELLSAIHLGLRRCQAERSAALLDELRFRRSAPGQRSPRTPKKARRKTASK